MNHTAAPPSSSGRAEIVPGQAEPGSRHPEHLYRYDVFISYSQADAGWTWDCLVPRLKAAGLEVCTDEESFEPGAPVAEETERAIRESRYTVVVLSPAWVESAWAGFESLLIQRQDPNARWRRLIPLLVTPCDPPERIKLLHWVDLTRPASRDAQLERVICRLQGASDLPELRVDLFPEPRKRRIELRWYAVAAVAAVLTLAVLAGWIVLQGRVPTVMPEGDFNIAVAEFGVVDPSGQPLKDEAGRERASSIAAFLEGEVDALRATVGTKVNVWGPEHRVTPVGRDEEAARAKMLNADVLVHGVLRQADQGRRWSLEPSFYLADPAVANASELSGEHALGTIEYQAESTGSQGDLNRSLNVRVRALVQLVDGLSHYADGDYRAAEAAFQVAADDPAWGKAKDHMGQEVLYLFLGNAQLMAAPSSAEDPVAGQELLARSQANYEYARELNPNYARALNGLGSVRFELARPGADSDGCDWDWPMLAQAQEAYAQALAAPQPAKPPSGFVDLRAHLGLGQTYYEQYWCTSEPQHSDLAREHLGAALKQYDALTEPERQLLAWEAILSHTVLGELASSAAEALPDFAAAAALAEDSGSREVQAYARDVVMPFLLTAYCADGQVTQAHGALDRFIDKQADGSSNRAGILEALDPGLRGECFPGG